MKKKKIMLTSIMIGITLVAMLLLILTKISNDNETIINLTYEEKMKDFEYLWDNLNNSYPFWNEVSEKGVDKNAIYKKYKKEIQNSNTDIEFMKLIGYFLKEFKGYGHLSALDGYMYDFYNDTFALGKTELNNEEMLRMAPWYDVLYNPKSKQTYSLLDISHSGFRNVKGLKEEYAKKNSSTVITQEANKSNLVFDIIEEDKIAYLKINSFELNNIEIDQLQLQEFFEEIAQYRHLIIDIQSNSGGSDNYWQDLIVSPNISKAKTSKRYYLVKQSDINNRFLNVCFKNDDIFPIKNLPELDRIKKNNLSLYSNYVIDEKIIYPSNKESKFKGKTWVLTSPKVYSSSENFVMFCKSTGFATLVGTSTGGDGGVVDPILFSLPNSGLIVRFSMFYGLNNDGTGNELNGTLPDILIKNNENALDVCISEIK